MAARPATSGPGVATPAAGGEGDTLVVETTHFLDKMSESWQNISKAASTTMHLVERWTRTGPDTMGYQVTVTDPAKFTQPWTVELTLTNLETPDDPLVFFEYACAEGNYGIINILSAQRSLEKTDPSLMQRRTDLSVVAEPSSRALVMGGSADSDRLTARGKLCPITVRFSASPLVADAP